MGLRSFPTPHLSFLGAGEHPLLACIFLCHFFGTEEGDRCWDELGDGGVLQLDADVLSAESERPNSETSLRSDSIRLLA